MMNKLQAKQILDHHIMRFNQLGSGRYTFRNARVYGSRDKERFGDKSWAKIFVEDSNGISIGRVTFEFTDKCRYLTIHPYWKWNWEYNDESERIFILIEFYLETGRPIVNYDMHLEEAKKIVEADYQRKVQWRKDNPPTRFKIYNGEKVPKNSRKKLQKKNLRYVIKELIWREFEEEKLFCEEINNGISTGR